MYICRFNIHVAELLPKHEMFFRPKMTTILYNFNANKFTLMTMIYIGPPNFCFPKIINKLPTIECIVTFKIPATNAPFIQEI